MPTYGYQCPSCATEFEVVQRMTAEAVANCPKCATPSRRLFFPTGIVFKGSGFYATDSRRGSAGISPGSGEKTSAGTSDGEKAATGSGGAKAPTKKTSGASDGGAAPSSGGSAAGTTAA